MQHIPRPEQGAKRPCRARSGRVGREAAVSKDKEPYAFRPARRCCRKREASAWRGAEASERNGAGGVRPPFVAAQATAAARRQSHETSNVPL
jgi:hypothetical protein